MNDTQMPEKNQSAAGNRTNADSLKKRMIIAVLCIVVTLLICLLLYLSQFPTGAEEAELAEAIAAFVPHSSAAQILETTEIGSSTLIAFFRDSIKGQETVGYARFARGLNGRYRIVGEYHSSEKYSSVITAYGVDTPGERALVVCGYHCGPEIAAYGLDLYKISETYAYSTRNGTLQFPVPGRQFIEVHDRAALEERILAEFGAGVELMEYYESATLLDGNGNDVTAHYELDGSLSANADSTTDDSKAVFITMIALIVICMIAVWLLLAPRRPKGRTEEKQAS